MRNRSVFLPLHHAFSASGHFFFGAIMTTAIYYRKLRLFVPYFREKKNVPWIPIIS
jgi:hypothetical protein